MAKCQNVTVREERKESYDIINYSPEERTLRSFLSVIIIIFLFFILYIFLLLFLSTLGKNFFYAASLHTFFGQQTRRTSFRYLIKHQRYISDLAATRNFQLSEPRTGRQLRFWF